MQIAGRYSVQNAQTVLESRFPQELAEVQTIIASVAAKAVLTSSVQQRLQLLNHLIQQAFTTRQWQGETLICEHSSAYYIQEWQGLLAPSRATRELDFVKNKIGVDILFKKTEPAVYDICAEMTIFHNHGLIEAGIGIIPIQSFARTLSTQVPCFEQFIWDLQHRGVSNIDIPVLILGVAA